MLWGLAAWTAGSSAAWLSWFAGVAALAIWLPFWRLRRKKRRSRILLWFFLCFFAGMFRQRLLLEQEKKIFTEPVCLNRIFCTVESVRETASDQMQGIVYSPAFTGKALLYEKDLCAGQKLELDLTLQPVENLGNPGEFDAKTYYRIRGIYYKAQAERIRIVENGNAAWPDRLRGSLAERIRSLIRQPEAGILTAVLLGEDQELDDTVKTEFQNMGISHILVVSGLHIGLVYQMLCRLLSRRLPARRASAAGIAVLWIYTMVTGSAVSTVRASILCTISGAQKICGARQDPLNSFAASAMILLAANPLYCLDIGFQLSFGAVLSIHLFQNLFKRCFWIPSGLRQSIASIFAVTSGTAPLSSYYFFKWSPCSLLLNFLILPGMGILFASGAGMLLISLFWKEGALVLSGGISCLLTALRMLVQEAARLPGAVWCTGRPNLLFLSAYYSFLGAVLWQLNLPTGKKKKAARRAMIAGGAAMACLLVIKPGNQWDCTFLNVGQGDCCVIENAGRVWLIDAGPEYRRAVKPYLQSRGVMRIEGVFLSHGDWDHTESAAALLEDPDFQIQNWFWPAGSLHENSRLLEMASRAQEQGASVYRLERGRQIQWGKLLIQCLAPDEEYIYSDENSASMVLVVTDGTTRLLFCGDADMSSEARFANQAGACDIIKIAHHGSRTGTSTTLLQAVRPELAVISCDRQSSYRHPHRETVERLKTYHIGSLVTDDTGAIRLRIGPGGWTCRTGP